MNTMSEKFFSHTHRRSLLKQKATSIELTTKEFPYASEAEEKLPVVN